MAGRSYKDLEVWKEAMDFVVYCYRVTETFPKKELYGLASQFQRAAVSIPANIAEGQGRQHKKEFLQHVAIAYGSLAEVETYIQIAQRLDYVDAEKENQLFEKAGRIGRMLNGLRKSIQERINKQ
jgi:four helix bundle protein